MKFYWLDALSEYENTITSGVMRVFDAIYKPYAKENGFEFEYIDAAGIIPVSSDKNMILYEGKDILQNRAAVFISYANAQPQLEKILESVTRIAYQSDTWTIVNCTGKGIFLDKDKFAGISMARELGAPVLPTIVIPSNKKSRALIKDIEAVLGNYPYIVKPKEMLAGIGIIKIDSAESLKSIFDIIGQSARDYIAQPFIGGARDYRVYTDGGKIIACLQRQPADGEYLASISRSGKGSGVTAPENIAALTEKIAEVFGGDYLCVDWLAAGNKFWFSEIESGGGFSALPEPERGRVAKAFFNSNRKRQL